jgi:hypothetical protein
MTYLIDSRVVRIRKARHCWGCEDRFESGSLLERSTSVDGGQAMSVYWCAICVAWGNSVEWHHGEGIDRGDFAANEYYDEFAAALPNDEKKFRMTTAERNRANKQDCQPETK